MDLYIIQMSNFILQSAVPSFSINPDDFFFAQCSVCANQGEPVFSVCQVSYTYDFGVNTAPILLFLSNRYVDREKISGPATTLLTAVIDLLDVLPLAIVFIADPGADSDHCDCVQTFVRTPQ